MGLLDVLNKKNFEESEKRFDEPAAPASTMKKETPQEKTSTFLNNIQSRKEQNNKEQENIKFAHSHPESDIIKNSTQNVVNFQPRSYEDAKIIGQTIDDGKICILNLDEVNPDLATRILDFVYGVCFIKKIKPNPIDAKILYIDPSEHERVERLRK